MHKMVLGLIGLVTLVSFAYADAAGTREKIATIEKIARELSKEQKHDELVLGIRLRNEPPTLFKLKKRGKAKDAQILFVLTIPYQGIGTMLASQVQFDCVDRDADGTVNSCSMLGFDGSWRSIRSKEKDLYALLQMNYELHVGRLEAFSVHTAEETKAEASKGDI